MAINSRLWTSFAATPRPRLAPCADLRPAKPFNVFMTRVPAELTSVLGRARAPAPYCHMERAAYCKLCSSLRCVLQLLRPRGIVGGCRLGAGLLHNIDQYTGSVEGTVTSLCSWTPVDVVSHCESPSVASCTLSLFQRCLCTCWDSGVRAFMRSFTRVGERYG